VAAVGAEAGPGQGDGHVDPAADRTLVEVGDDDVGPSVRPRAGSHDAARPSRVVRTAWGSTPTSVLSHSSSVRPSSPVIVPSASATTTALPPG
jgi:hypothetical protein